MQVVKGWVDAAGADHERVFDVACADGLAVDPATHRCPDNGASVDLSDCSTTGPEGANELATAWQDPDFAADSRAFYYVRVLQIPTPRNSLYDSIALQQPPPEGYPATIQERAYTSPIWYSPAKG